MCTLRLRWKLLFFLFFFFFFLRLTDCEKKGRGHTSTTRKNERVAERIRRNGHRSCRMCVCVSPPQMCTWVCYFLELVIFPRRPFGWRRGFASHYYNTSTLLFVSFFLGSPVMDLPPPARQWRGPAVRNWRRGITNCSLRAPPRPSLGLAGPGWVWYLCVCSCRPHDA